MGTAIDHLFPATRRALLECFFLYPEKRYYLREVIKKVNKGQGSVQRELRNLVDAGVVAAERSEGRVYYSVDSDCLIYNELRSIISKTSGIVPTLRSTLRQISGIRLAFVFGSVASGQHRGNSDIDLAVLGDVSFREVVKAISRNEASLGREINPVVFSTVEFRNRRKNRDHFILELVQTEKQWIIGSQNDFEAVVG